MKFLVLAAGLLFTTVSHGQAPYWQLARDKIPNTSLRFGTETDCRVAVPKIGLPGIYTCEWQQEIKVTASIPAVSTSAPPVASSVSGNCSALFKANPITSLVSSSAVDAMGTNARPSKGISFKESAYGTCVARATDKGDYSGSSFLKNDYSRRQAFNSDSTYQLVASQDGYWHIYDTNTHAYIKRLNGPAGDAEPQWSATDPKTLWFIPTNGIGMKMMELDVNANTSKTIVDFSSRLKAKWSASAAAWTRSEGSPSADGRYWCFMVDDGGWNSVGVFTWDKQTDTILGTYSTNGDRPDHVSMSPTGNYCVVSGDGALGTAAFTRDFGTKVQLLKNSEHSDLALDANGDDVYVAVDYASNDGDVFMKNIRTGVRTPLFKTYVDGTTTALHFSGKAFRKPGWVLVSTYADGSDSGNSGARKWLHRKVMAVQLQANPKIYSLAFTRDFYRDYDSAPVASVNRDFNKVVFNSNWGGSDVDAYNVEFPSELLK